MTWRQLPPVGTPVRYTFEKSISDKAVFHVPNFYCDYYQSGTAALAKAISMSIAAQKEPTRRDVLLPGYGCPDLVAAVIHAGANPVIIDLTSEKYSFNLAQVKACAEKAAAIVCPALLGVSMPIGEIKAILPRHVKIIEDDAQWFPEATTVYGRQSNLANMGNYQLPDECSYSDFIVASFGRGKPVNLMGGGMLLSRTSQDIGNINMPVSTPLSFRVKSTVFNALMQPFLYGTLTRMPGLNIGTTAYHRLNSIERIEDFKRSLVTPAIVNYLKSPLATATSYSNVGPCAWSNQAKRLLRLPILVDDIKSRDLLIANCINQGITATAMYKRALYDIPGIASISERPMPTPVSDRLAETLVTLPTHSGVKEEHKAIMHRILMRFEDKLTEKVSL